MKIVINKENKTLELTKNDGTVIDSCGYKNIIDDDYTMEDLIQDNDKFNKTLSSFKEFDKIKDLGAVIKMHDWDM